MALVKCEACEANVSEGALACPSCGHPRRSKEMGFFEGLCWVVVLIAAAAAVWQLFDTFANAQSAPQQAAGAAMNAATVIAPYCFARAVRALSGR